MSKKLIVTLIIFIAAISVLIYVNVTYTSSPVSRKLSPTPIKQVPSQEASFFFSPNPIIIPSGQSASVDVSLDTKTEATLIQIEVEYNPRYIYGVSILPSNYFADPAVALEKVDAKNGRISYALQGNIVNKEAKTVATINFTTVGTTAQVETKFSFLPKTTVRSNEEIAIKNALPAQVILKPSLFTPLATQSGAFIR